jgi:hypothetical protein
MGARDGAAFALAEYLKTVEFFAYGGDVSDRAFKARNVYPYWPKLESLSAKPSISITDAGPSDDDDFDMTVLEELHDQGSQDVAVTLEKKGMFQIDLWPTTQPEREAMMAGISRIFLKRPARLLLGIHPAALPARLRDQSQTFRCRFVLDSAPEIIDSKSDAEMDMWRARAIIAWDAALVSLEQIPELLLIPITGGLVA